MIAIVFHLFLHTQLSGWELLSSVDIVRAYDEFMGIEIEKPQFPKELMEREGSEIVLKGYVVPVQQEEAHDFFVLSRFPYQSCFFCGGAGPETVAEIYAKKSFSFTDNRIRVRGTLRLNRDNPLHLFYILENCEVSRLD